MLGERGRSIEKEIQGDRRRTWACKMIKSTSSSSLSLLNFNQNTDKRETQILLSVFFSSKHPLTLHMSLRDLIPPI